MKVLVCKFVSLAVGLTALVVVSQPRVALAAANPPAQPSVGSGSPAQGGTAVEIPQSIFKEGRNPFFPHSTIDTPRPVPPPPSSDFSGFTLNGITSPPKRSAMINGRTFEPGEEGEVRLSNGSKVLIKCEEVKAESAVITYAGQRRELRLRSGF